MDIENLKYIGDQILGYLSLLRDKTFMETLREGIEFDFREYGSFPVSVGCTAKFTSNYPRPEDVGITCRVVPTHPLDNYDLTNLKEKRFYFQLTIKDKITNKMVRLSIRLSTIMKVFDNMKRTHASIIRQTVTKQIGFKNLIIVDSKNPDLNEICLQLGIYLFREGLFNDKWVLYGLYQEVVKSLVKDIDLDDTAIFDRLLKRFLIPSHVRSFRIYLNIMLKELKSQEFKKQDRFGLPKQTIYTLIRRGYIHVPKEKGKYNYNDGTLYMEIQVYKKNKDNRITLQDFAKILSENREITIESAERTLRRWKAKGLTLQQIAQQIKSES
ncbi:MAG: hypothetical protein ACREOW_10290 [Thermodesulfobacteriota bacterium]